MRICQGSDQKGPHGRVASRGVYEGVYERPAGNYLARYRSQCQDYESSYNVQPSPLPLPFSFFLLCFYCYHCQRGLRKLPEFLPSYLRMDFFFFSLPLFSFFAPEETAKLSKTIFTRSRSSDLFFAGVFQRTFFARQANHRRGTAFLLSLSRKGD